MSDDVFSRLPDALLPWYTANMRDLPWRKDRQPYHIWVSEIMLQQTRVEAVRGYYARFLEALPSVEDLAQAPDDTLHKLWEGLGYYSRVRNLKKAAQMLVSEFGSAFPKDYKKILSLPGVGPYTAGAICSIAFDLPTPAVDGNVLRVVSRLTNDATPVDLPAYRKCVEKSLSAVYPDRAGDFTQALMELGATVCGPNKKPDCTGCPCNGFCKGYAAGVAEALPVKSPKRGRREQKRTVFILRCEDRFALCKRPDTGLLAGLWEFPNIEGWPDTQQALDCVEQMGLNPSDITRQVEKEHIFTHIHWHMRGVYVDVKEMNDRYVWLTSREIHEEVALPTAFRQFWDIGECDNGR